MKKDSRFANIATQLQGQAGVWAVAAQLAIRGHIPSFPGVDYGFDLMIENGIRIQVKSSRLVGKKRGKYGVYPAYCFNIRKTSVNYEKRARSVSRDWTKVTDFFVLWGIDDNRFWIVPTAGVGNSAICLTQRDPISENAGMSGGMNPTYRLAIERRALYEGRWDLLSVNETVGPLVESAVDSLKTKEQI